MGSREHDQLRPGARRQRGKFRKDLLDAERLVGSGWVDARQFRELVEAIPDSAYARYPNLSRQSVLDAVGDFFAGLPPIRPEG